MFAFLSNLTIISRPMQGQADKLLECMLLYEYGTKKIL